MAGVPLRKLMSHAPASQALSDSLRARLRRASNHECGGRLRRHSRRGTPTIPAIAT
jgi:hypothetical protein